MPNTEPEAAPRVPTLETARLVLRPLVRGDLPAVAELASDESVATRTARMPYPFRLKDAEAWFAELEGEEREIVFAIERRSDGVFLGAIGIVLADDGHRSEVGFWLGRPYWNRGYMTEALDRVLAHAFDGLGLAAVLAGAFPDNGASLRVQAKVGMRAAGRQVRPAPARGGDREVVVYVIRREERRQDRRW